MRITRNHMDELGYCAKGARRWAARMDMDWAAFVHDGIDVVVLQATGDAMALRLIEHVMDVANSRLSRRDGIQPDKGKK